MNRKQIFNNTNKKAHFVLYPVNIITIYAHKFHINPLTIMNTFSAMALYSYEHTHMFSTFCVLKCVNVQEISALLRTLSF